MSFDLSLPNMVNVMFAGGAALVPGLWFVETCSFW